LFELSREWLYQSYVVEVRPLVSLAAESGVSSRTIGRRLHKEGIPVRGKNETKRIRGVISYDWLYQSYVVEKMTIQEMAILVGCSCWSIRDRLVKGSIGIRKTYERQNHKKIVIVDSGGGCKLCTSHWQLKHGYYMIRRNMKAYLLHRYLYMLHHSLSEEDMFGLVVMHTCDNPACINIDHLRLGTQKENMQDMVTKGRRRHPKFLTSV